MNNERYIRDLYLDLFLDFDPNYRDSIANKIINGKSIQFLFDSLDNIQDPTSNKLNPELGLFDVKGMIDDAKKVIENEINSTEKRQDHIETIKQKVLTKVKEWINQYGVCYTYNAVDSVHTYMYVMFQEEEMNSFITREDALMEIEEKLLILYTEASKISLNEKIIGLNKTDIQAYISSLRAYADECISFAIDKWAHDLKKVFCNDKDNDELSKIMRCLTSFRDKAAAINHDAIKALNMLNITLESNCTINGQS